MWYDKMANTSIKALEKTLDKFVKNLESIFFPLDIKATAHCKLTAQKSSKWPGGVIDNALTWWEGSHKIHCNQSPWFS